MVGAGVVALIAFVLYLGIGVRRRADALAENAAPATTTQTPSATRLLGLALFALMFLALNWFYLPQASEYAVLSMFVYPAAFALGLVLLFDKATRTWSDKSASETIREWLLCDTLVFAVVLGYVNLLTVANAEEYHAFFWDTLFLALALLVFWCLDRTHARSRFAVVYAWFTIAPLLLAIWRWSQGDAGQEADDAVEVAVSWWQTIWPFFTLGIAFFLLELIALAARADHENPTVQVVKEALFVILFGAFLLAARP